ncbi:MAG: biotin-independent malonate decarboxylase subunit beta [Neptuniibacter sp.]
MNTANKLSIHAHPSFIEQSARKRTEQILDTGSMRELLSPFAKVSSPWLEKQGVIPQFDDGVIVARGTIQGNSAVVAAIEGAFQGGSLGEVGGAKIATVLEQAIAENKKGNPTTAILILETGGVRLQEANLGLASIAEIQSAIVELRSYAPVIAIVTGPVGCFGGMSITAGLCSHILITQEGRLGLNGPLVIEQEAGIEEYNSKDRPFIWSLTGGNQRFNSGFADAFLPDNPTSIREAVINCTNSSSQDRCNMFEMYLDKLSKVDTSHQIDAETVRTVLS